MDSVWVIPLTFEPQNIELGCILIHRSKNDMTIV